MNTPSLKILEILDWGLLDYEEAFRRQKDLVEERIADISPDRLVLVEHPPAVTIGRSGGAKDLKISGKELAGRGVGLHRVDRGGMATFHGPGQLVAYPIVKLSKHDLHAYLRKLQHVVETVLQGYGLDPGLKEGEPGVWAGSGKIASIGVAVRRWVTYHGMALNVDCA